MPARVHQICPLKSRPPLVSWETIRLEQKDVGTPVHVVGTYAETLSPLE